MRAASAISFAADDAAFRRHCRRRAIAAAMPLALSPCFHYFRYAMSLRQRAIIALPLRYAITLLLMLPLFFRLPRHADARRFRR